MIKKEQHIWIYLIGSILMFGVIFILGKEVVLPLFKSKGKLPISIDTPFTKPSMTIDTTKQYIAKMYTNFGIIEFELYASSAPQNVNSFVFLSSKGYYNDTKFHRLIPDLLIQGGDRNTLDSDPTNDGKGRPNYLVEDEVNWDSLGLSDQQKKKLADAGYSSNSSLVSHPLEKYSLAMANSGPNTNGSQFFIVTASQIDSRLSDLNGFFTVIGKVRSGTDVVEKMNQVQVDDPNSQNPRPKDDIIIQKIDISQL